jgi:hypothetical protein
VPTTSPPLAAHVPPRGDGGVVVTRVDPATAMQLEGSVCVVLCVHRLSSEAVIDPPLHSAPVGVPQLHVEHARVSVPPVV